jgi:CTP-dependent riboflavin kinase
MALDWVQNALKEKLGFTVYPATLNVRPSSPQALARWEQVKLKTGAIEIVPPEQSFCCALCFPLEVSTGETERIQGAALWPQVENYPPDKVEIVAPVNIKESLGVRDGDSLRLEFI